MNNEKKLRTSFKAVKKDIECLKDNSHEWITFLHSNQQAIMDKLNALENKLKDIELLVQR